MTAAPRPAHATDFTWFRRDHPDLAEAYCLTLVQGLTAEELQRRFGAVPAGEVVGLREVTDTGPDGREEDDHPVGELPEGIDPENWSYVAVTELDGWALAVEPNGYLGVTPEAIARLAEGTRLVSHFRNINAVDHFHWWEHGTRRLHFEPLFPTQRDGEDAEGRGTSELLTACGFHLDDDSFDLHTEAAFALAERLTDVRLAPERLAGLTFRLGYVPGP
ncbi:DUF6461 domain-containing protein [Kitasatospora sp. NPDC101183]|uniref:DUF6461 domain-containing protein n=1 Tax=Kitasatospora sp. NPDC101183 TaxID=3364100 RepID=UPI0037F50A6B